MKAALERTHGREILTIEQLVARLAGGFLRPIGQDDLKTEIAVAIQEPLGELDAIKDLPGFKRAAAASLSRAWAAGLSLEDEAETDSTGSGRIADLAALESRVLKRLPGNQLRPRDLVEAAMRRVGNAPALFGRIEIHGRTEMSPVWRPLLKELGRVMEVEWLAEARQVPEWLGDTGIKARKMQTQRQEGWKPVAVSCATARHEVLEAVRWVRRHLVRGVKPEQIALTAPSPSAWDDHVLAIAGETNIPVHFIHGKPALASPEGQLAAALAEVLLRGPSLATVARLVALLSHGQKKYRSIHVNWWRKLDSGASLATSDQWLKAIASLAVPDPQSDFRPLLEEIVQTLSPGIEHAQEIGQQLLGTGTAVNLWNQALIDGPPAALDVTLGRLRIRDETEPCASVAWGPAAMIAAAPREYCWLLGLTSRSWPRHPTEDPLLPNHVIPEKRLNPLPVHEADRRDFRTICDMTSKEVVFSRARRSSEGSLNGISPLYAPAEEKRLPQSRAPQHAASDGDRLMARPAEFLRHPRAKSSLQTWHAWHSDSLSPHDGRMRANHPLLFRALDRIQSASSLAKLLRDPLGYLWTYGFGWREPEESEDPLTLDAVGFGLLLHGILQESVTRLEQSGGFSEASEDAIRQAVNEAAQTAGTEPNTGGTLPPLILQRKIEEAAELAFTALTVDEEPLKQQTSWSEIPFGGIKTAEASGAEDRVDLPWDPGSEVLIPETNIRIGGVIDRLDLSGDRTNARVTDYKSGKRPKEPPQLANGKELQRCLYAFATRSLIDNEARVEARLLYPRTGQSILSLDDPDMTLKKLTGYLGSAYALFLSGQTLSGPAAGDDWYDLAFALPGGATESYLERKLPEVLEALEDIAPLWDED